MDEDCGGERCFTAGETYEFKFEVDAWVTKDDQDEDHWMPEDDLAELTK